MSFSGSSIKSGPSAPPPQALPWSECRTVPEMGAFIFKEGLVLSGRAISWTYNSALCPLVRCVQTIARFIFKTVIWDNLLVRAGEALKGIYSYIEPCLNGLYTHVLCRAVRAIREVARFIFKTVIWDNVLVRAGEALKGIYSYIKPCLNGLYTHVLCRVGRAIRAFYF